MTHEYTLLMGGRVIRGAGEPDATAIAWAADTILAIGSDEEVRAISRGDSRFVDLGGATVSPPKNGTALEAGGPADLVIVAGGREIAEIRGGQVIQGTYKDLPSGGLKSPPPPDR